MWEEIISHRTMSSQQAMRIIADLNDILIAPLRIAIVQCSLEGFAHSLS